jgi:hypothetical protein
MKPLTEQIRYWLQTNWTWHAKGKLTADMVWKHKGGKHNGARFLPETVGRALRSLEERRVVAVKQDGVSVQYKWLPINRRKSYIPFSERPNHQKEKLFK